MEAPEDELEPDAIRELMLRKERSRENSRRYYQRHREQELARTRKYAIENKEVVAYKKKLWYYRRKEEEKMVTEKMINDEIAKIEDKRKGYLQNWQLYEAKKCDDELRRLNDKLQYMIDNDRDSLNNAIKGLPEEERDFFEYKTLLLVVLSDLLDGVVMDINGLLNRHTEFSKLDMTEQIKHIKELTGKLIKRYDKNCNEETAEDYGKFSDEILPWLDKKAQEHIAWIQMGRNKIAYANEK